jgi:hypothetical protein
LCRYNEAAAAAEGKEEGRAAAGTTAVATLREDFAEFGLDIDDFNEPDAEERAVQEGGSVLDVEGDYPA